MAHGALGTVFLRDNGPRQEHQKAVAHVRHHDAVKQDEEGRHEGVGVHVVVGGEGVHLRHHVQRLGQPVVLQPDRHVGDVLVRGVAGLPGAALGVQQGLDLRQVLRRGPALEKDDGSVGEEALGVLILRRLGGKAVGVEPQPVPLRRQGGDGGLGLLPLGVVVLQGLVQGRGVLRRRARHALKSGDAEPVRPEDLQDLLLLLPVGHQEAAALLLVPADLIELRRRARQFTADGGGVRRPGENAQAEHRVFGAAELQGHVQGNPGLQPGLPAQEAVLLSL